MTVPAADPRGDGFPSAEPQSASAEETALSSLVHHRGWVSHDLPLEAVNEVFRAKNVEYLALVRDGLVTGLCSQIRLGQLLGSRYGFALYSKSAAHTAQVEHPLVFPLDYPVRRILDRALSRNGDEFHEDVVLVDGSNHLIGLIPVERLAHLQTRLVAEQMGELRRQHELLMARNLELFQINQAHRQAQGLSQRLFDSSAIGVALFDLRGSVQAHNRRLAQLLNLREGEALGDRLAGWIRERDRTAFHDLLLAHERGSVGAEAREFAFEIPGRGQRLLRFSTALIPETSQVCACVEDVTEQRSLERHLLSQEKQKLLDAIVGGIAHELNNKLTPVLGFCELIELEAEPKVRAYTDAIGKSVVEAAKIIRQLLQLSKPHTGSPQLVDLARLVEESLMMLRFQTRENRVAIKTELGPGPVNVYVDPGHLKQVLLNLLLNSVHATRGSEAARIDLRLGTEAKGVYLQVRDNGVGIRPELIERIFDPFFTTKTPDQGSGLGLSICAALIRQHGGEIAVESEVGKGAVFTIRLPSSAGRGGAVLFDPPASVPGGIGGESRVLIVEDEDVIRYFLEEALRSRFGCRVDAVADGKAALELIGRNAYQLIVSDIRMPDVSGPDLYRRLLAFHAEAASRMVFVTGYVGDTALEKEIAEWGVPVIAKPFKIERLTEVCLPFLV